jgi:hypothetical protein
MEVSKEGFARGVRILHFLGGSSVDVSGERAIAQTKMTISQRAEVHGVPCDVVCTGRFYDFLERRAPQAAGGTDPQIGHAGAVVEEPDPAGGRWGIVLRQPIYEKDRLDPLDPAATLSLDQARLGEFPDGYRHLAYVQSQIGYEVKRDMPGLTGPEVEQLYADGRAWLAGQPLGR